MTRVLFCSSEVSPFSKTGGLGDLAAALPKALTELGIDVRILTPAYRGAIEAAPVPAKIVAQLELPWTTEPVRILETRLPEASVPVYLLDAGTLYDRDGSPYLDRQGRDWEDNANRFAIFCRAIVEVAMGRSGIDFLPHIVHCNDWQTGLVPLLLTRENQAPASVFAINNLQYQGLFDYADFLHIGLDPSLFSPEGVEFNGRFSFIKGGLVYADRLVTVSPTYATEIQTPELGCGLDGLLRHRSKVLSGIVNGIDTTTWNPATDPLIEQRYDADHLADRTPNKLALQKEFGLKRDASAFLIAHIGRLAHQKGADLLATAMPALLSRPGVQLAVLGMGDAGIASDLTALANSYPGAMSFRHTFSERLAHRVEAGADLFVMPSRYEPCGLNQMYSMRYGAVPLVRRTGGLMDTVTCTEGNVTGTGFCFTDFEPAALEAAFTSALDCYRNSPVVWSQIVRDGMTSDFSWQASSVRYNLVYQSLQDGGPCRS